MEEGTPKRIRTFKVEGVDYKFDPLIFEVMIGSLLVIIVLTGFVYGFQADKNFYVYCDPEKNIVCENPLYNNFAYCGKTIPIQDYICNQELLPAGFVYGKPPPPIFKIFELLTMCFLIFAFIVNHIIYNKESE